MPKKMARKKSSVKWRIILTIIILISYYLISSIYGTASGPIEAEIAAEQVKDDNIDYTVAKGVSKGAIPKTIFMFSIAVLGIIWVPYGVNKTQILLKK